MEYVTPISCDQTDPERPYVDGCDANGQLGSRTPARFFNLILSEGRNLVEGAGLTLDPLNDMQWLEAVQSLADTAAATAIAPVEARVTTLETQVADLDGRTGVLETRANALENRADSLEMRDDAIVVAAGMMPNQSDPDEVLNAIRALIRSDGVPTGSVQAFAQSTPPAGWLICDGRAVSRTTYANLFATIGTTYGDDNGSTTMFNLPDLRGEFVRGWDNGRGVDPGRLFGVAQAHEIDSHSHRYFDSDTIHVDLGRGGNSPAPTIDGNPIGQATRSFREGGDETVVAIRTVSTGGTETRPRNVALLYCIKA